MQHKIAHPARFPFFWQTMREFFLFSLLPYRRSKAFASNASHFIIPVKTKKCYIWGCACFRAHYIEYLCGLVRDNALDPVIVLSSDDLETIVRRAHKRLPPRAYGMPDAKYREALLQVSFVRRARRKDVRHAVISQCFTPRPTFPRSLNFQFGSLHAFYARAAAETRPARYMMMSARRETIQIFISTEPILDSSCRRETEKLSNLHTSAF